MEANGHQWRVLAQYEITPDDALRLTAGSDDRPPTELYAGEVPDSDDPRPFLGTHNLLREEMVVVCMRCESAFTPGIGAQECPGEPDGHAPDGTPLFGGKPFHEKALDGGNIPGKLSPPERPGRNDKCPCGSGKKFKKCHGA